LPTTNTAGALGSTPLPPPTPEDVEDDEPLDEPAPAPLLLEPVSSSSSSDEPGP